MVIDIRNSTYVKKQLQVVYSVNIGFFLLSNKYIML